MACGEALILLLVLGGSALQKTAGILCGYSAVGRFRETLRLGTARRAGRT